MKISKNSKFHSTKHPYLVKFEVDTEFVHLQTSFQDLQPRCRVVEEDNGKLLRITPDFNDGMLIYRDDSISTRDWMIQQSLIDAKDNKGIDFRSEYMAPDSGKYEFIEGECVLIHLDKLAKKPVRHRQSKRKEAKKGIKMVKVKPQAVPTPDPIIEPEPDIMPASVIETDLVIEPTLDPAPDQAEDLEPVPLAGYSCKRPLAWAELDVLLDELNWRLDEDPALVPSLTSKQRMRVSKTVTTVWHYGALDD